MNFIQEIRSQFKNIFGHEEQQVINQGVAYRMLNSWDNYFFDSPKDLYLNPTVRLCIDTIAKNFAKVEIHHVRENTRQNDKLETILQRPNALMNTYDFLYKVVSLLYMNGNVFIYIQTDAKGEITGLYPLTASSYELREVNNEMYVKFQFANSSQTICYRNLIHLRKHFCSHEVLGSNSDEALLNQLNILQSTEQALQNTVKNASKIKGIISLNNVIRPQDREKILSEFTERFVKGNIGILDQSASFQAVNSSDSTVDFEKMSYMRKAIYSYFGLNEDIINSSFDSKNWNAFYESVLEPLAVQFSNEFSDKIFTESEKEAGHKIVIYANRLEYESFESKINMTQNLLNAGVLSINEARKIFGFDAVDGGDERQISLNYVQAKNQEEYQLGHKEEAKKEENQEEETND